MNDNGKQVTSYQQDQEILDSRGIAMTVEEVAGLPTSKYAERVQELKLDGANLAFLKGLRRRIKNRLASQNSRRRSMEQLRRLSRELRAVQACRLTARRQLRALSAQRDALRSTADKLRAHVAQILRERSDPTPIPDLVIPTVTIESHIAKDMKQKETNASLIPDYNKTERDKHIFECCIDKLVEQSVNHIFKEKKINAKTVFLEEKQVTSNVKYYSSDLDATLKGILENNDGGVLNLSVKRETRRSHGRKQSAPRRIAYEYNSDDCVLDLKIKKENQ